MELKLNNKCNYKYIDTKDINIIDINIIDIINLFAKYN